MSSATLPEKIAPGVKLGIMWLQQRNDTLQVTGYDEERHIAHVSTADSHGNLRYREVYLKNGTPHFREIRNGQQMAEFRITRENKSEPVDFKAARPSRRHRRRPPEQPVTEIRHNDTVQSLFVKRTELTEQLKKLDYKWARNMDWETFYMMGAIREAISKVEERIMVTHEEAQEA